MFDIDGTLVQSYDFDSECFVSAVKEVLGIEINSDWSIYRNVTDAGILDEILDSIKVSGKRVTHNKVKNVFINKIQESIQLNPVQEVLGASLFIEFLKAKDSSSR